MLAAIDFVRADEEVTLRHGVVREASRMHRFERWARLVQPERYCAEPFAGDFDGDGVVQLLFPPGAGKGMQGPITHAGSASGIVLQPYEILDRRRTELPPGALFTETGERRWFSGHFDGEPGIELASEGHASGRWELLKQRSTGTFELITTDCPISGKDVAVYAGAWIGDGRDLIGEYTKPGRLEYYDLSERGCPRRRKFLADRPVEPPLGAADFEGTRADQLFSAADRGRQWFVRWFTDSRAFDPLAPWADFFDLVPGGQDAPFPPWTSGDFTGDGKDDLLLWSGSPLHGWWLAASYGGTGLELPTRGLPDPLRHELRLLRSAGDADGDGVDELIVQLASCDLEIYRARTGRPLQGVELRAGSERTVSDAEGEFVIGGRGPVTAAKEGFRLVPHPRHETPVFTAYDLDSERKAHSAIPASGEGAPPFVCSGYVPGAPGSKWGRVAGLCPPGYAVMELDEPGRGADGKEVSTVASCCRLPEGMLAEADLVVATGRCPPAHVVVAAARIGGSAQRFEAELTCARVLPPYLLGEPFKGTYWGAGLSMRRESQELDREEIPPALRAAVGRMSILTWDIDGCVPRIPGALLVGVSGPGCSGTEFSTVRMGTDQKSAKPVQVLPRCAALADPIDPGAGCAE